MKEQIVRLCAIIAIVMGIMFSSTVSSIAMDSNEMIKEEEQVLLHSVFPSVINTQLNIGTDLVYNTKPEETQPVEIINKEMYTTNLVNVRTSPTTEEDNIFKVAAYGEQITVLEKSGDWYKVLFTGKECYIHDGLLTETKPEMYRYNASKEEYNILCRIVEAEVRGETGRWHGITDKELYMSKVRVAQNILNRVECKNFPNTIKGVVFQKAQYSPVLNGSYYKVTVTNMTRKAVDTALEKSTPDYTKKAIYFRSDNGSFSKYGEYLFTDALGMRYYGSYKCSCH